jgi:hypothetical protein
MGMRRGGEQVMHSLVAAALLTSGLVLGAGPAAGQARAAPDCRDDRGVDRCAVNQQARVRTLFGVPAIEQLQAQGAEVRRVFYVDGYGRDVIALTFLRAPGRDPSVTVHFAKREGEATPAPLEALVPAAVWRDAIRRSARFDRALAPRASDGAPSICLHSWVVTVEAVDTHGPGPAAVRRATQDSCDDGLATVFAMELAELAMPLFPYCDALDPELHRNNVTRLHACQALSGDRLAAAEAYNQALRLARVDGDNDAALGQGVFDWRAQLSWAGQRAGGDGGGAYRAWLARLNEGGRARFYPIRAVGERADRVRVEGRMVRYGEETGGRQTRHEAPVSLLFVSRSNNPGLRIEEARVDVLTPAS